MVAAGGVAAGGVTLMRNHTANRLRGAGGTWALAVSPAPLHPTQLQHGHLAVFLVFHDFYPIELHNQKGPGKHVPERQGRAAALSKNKRLDPLNSCWATGGGIGWSCVKRGGERSISQASVVSNVPHLICLRRMMRGKQGYQIKKNFFSLFPSFFSPF